jgi:lipoate-protein ligase A
MFFLDLTLQSPAENLALDEALLDEAEAADGPQETLRLWEPARNMAVVGRSSRIEDEVHLDVCRDLGIPILRRISGGAAIVAGPGCLMYALVLSYENHPDLRAINQAHAFVLGTLARALNPLLPSPFGRGTQRVPGGEGAVSFEINFCGISDLAIGDKKICSSHKTDNTNTNTLTPCPSPKGRGESFLELLKFSGNSMRCRRRHFLYHGTILYDFPLELISRCLKIPLRMPEYRNRRDHKNFIANLPVAAADIRRALISVWNAVEPIADWPRELTASLAAEKYGNPHWNQST